MPTSTVKQQLALSARIKGIGRRGGSVAAYLAIVVMAAFCSGMLVHLLVRMAIFWRGCWGSWAPHCSDWRDSVSAGNSEVWGFSVELARDLKENRWITKGVIRYR